MARVVIRLPEYDQLCASRQTVHCRCGTAEQILPERNVCIQLFPRSVAQRRRQIYKSFPDQRAFAMQEAVPLIIDCKDRAVCVHHDCSQSAL